MPLVKCLTIILLGCLISLHCVPVSQSNDASQSGSVPNPEYGNGLGKDDMVPYPPSKPLRGRGVAIRPVYNRWAGGIVPYEFASNVSVNNTLFIEQQMRTIESLTMVNNTQCVRFRPKNASDPYFLTIFNGSGCSAPVGSWGNYVGVRPVSLLAGLYSTCMISGIVQHELTHALGFYHEQSRPDRDQYVSLQWSNIDPNYVNNFIKYNDTDVDTQMTPYDYGSVMHYDRGAFALNSSGPTIIPTMNSSAFIGQRVQLSPTDILEIQRYYGCVPTPNITNTTTTAATTVTTTVTSTATTTITTTRTTTTTSATTTATSVSTTAAGTSTTSIGTTIATTTIGSGSTSTTTQNAAKPSAGVSNALPSYFGMYLTCFALILYL